MKSNHALRLITLACLGTVVTMPTFAQDTGSFYGGASVGRARFKLEPSTITATQTGQNASDISRNDKDTAYKVFGGYQVTPMFGVEAGFFDLGKSDFTATVPGGTFSGRIKSQGLNLDLVAKVPLTPNLSVLARVGAAYAKTRDEFASTGLVLGDGTSTSERDTKIKVGAGVQYALSPAMLLRTEVERYRISDGAGDHGHVNLLSVGLVFPFKGY